MRIVVLGCGGSAGVPMVGGPDGAGDWGVCDRSEPRNRRTRSSIVIEGDDGRRLLVDTGPELREQLLRCGIGWTDSLPRAIRRDLLFWLPYVVVVAGYCC